MIGWTAGGLLLALLVTASQPLAPDAPAEMQVVVRERVTVRIPVGRRPISPAALPIVWKESRGPRCLAINTVIGAALAGGDSVDLIMRDRSRVRAKLSKACPALDFYRGFYITPSTDGKVCADRDTVRSRTGGQCEIERFRALEAETRR